MHPQISFSPGMRSVGESSPPAVCVRRKLLIEWSDAKQIRSRDRVVHVYNYMLFTTFWLFEQFPILGLLRSYFYSL